jgi:protein transport protein SEC31
LAGLWSVVCPTKSIACKLLLLGVVGFLLLQVELTASDWDECGAWLTALKRLIKIRQTLG